MKGSTRLHGRIRYKTWVKVVVQDGPGVLGHVEEISPEGLVVEHDRILPVGREYHVYCMLTEMGREHIFHVRCRVDRCQRDGMSGRFWVGLSFIEFVSDPLGTPHLIERFIRQLQATPQ